MPGTRVPGPREAVLRSPGAAGSGRVGFHAVVVAGSEGVRSSVSRVLSAVGAAHVHDTGSLAQVAELRPPQRVGLAVVDARSVPLGPATSAVRALGCSRVVALAEDSGTVRAAVTAGVRCLVVTGPAAPEPAAADDAERSSEAAAVASLSPRELQVVAMAADGMSNQDIGAALGLSALTVKSHLARIAKKLGTGERARMVMLALQAGAIT